MDEVIQLCRLKVSGQNLPQETEAQLVSYMLEPANGENILRAALNDFSILLCYRSLTSHARRRGEHCFRYEDGAEEVRKLISSLEGIPSFESKDQNNLYLCLEGELLALSIFLEEPPESISSFLLCKVWEKDNSIEIKVHCMLKILTACLAEIIEMRVARHIESNLKKIILGFSMTYGVMFAAAISNISDHVLNNFADFSLVFETLASLQLTQENFFAAIGQEENIWNYREHGDGQQPYLMIWESEFLINWASTHCIMLQNLFNLLESPSLQEYKSREKCCKVMTRSLSLLLHILDLSFGSFEKGYKNLRATLLAQITANLIDQALSFFKIERIEDEEKKMCFSGEFHANLLKLLLYKNKLLTIQLAEITIDNFENNNTLEKLNIYISFVLKSQNFYYEDFNECPIGLAVKTRWKMNYILLLNFRNHSECTKSVLKSIEKKLDDTYEMFFESFLLEKLILNEDSANENEDLFTQGKDWQEFVTTALNSYFNEIALISPKYFSEFTTTDHETNDEDDMEEGEKLEENEIENKFIQKGLKFSKNKGFVFFTRMIDEIKINRLLKIDFLFDDADDKCVNTSNFVDVFNNEYTGDYNEPDSDEEEDEKAFAHLISILAAFRALIRVSINSEVRALLYYYYVQIEEEIKIHSLSKKLREKAKICKIYILHTFLEEYVPEEFVHYGEEASLTAVYLLKEFGFDLEYFVDNITSSLYECIDINEGEQEEVEIIAYGIGLIEELMKKLAGRLFDLEESYGKGASRDTVVYYNKINESFNVLNQLNIKTPCLVQRIFTLAGILIDINGYKVLYHIYAQLSQNLHSNSSAYLHGLIGLLGGISRRDYFRAAVEVSLGDLGEIVEEVGSGGNIDEEIIEVIVGVIELLVNDKVWDCVQNQIGLAVQDVFSAALPTFLHRCIQIPSLLPKCLKIYLKWLNFDILSPLIPLSGHMNWGDHPDILHAYFNAISRVGELRELEEYAMLKIDWLISFLESKIERDEDYDYNLGLIALNFRFEIQAKKNKMISLLSIISKVSCEEISSQLCELYGRNDACFEKFDE